MDAGRVRTADSVPCSVNILFHAARQRADGRAVHIVRDRRDRCSIAGRRSGKARFNNIYFQRFQLLGNLDFFVQVHAAAGRLLTVTQGRVKNSDGSCHVLVLSFLSWGVQGQKKLRPLIKIKRRSINSAVPLLLPHKIRPLIAHLTMRRPCNGGHPFPPTGQTAFSGPLPGEFHRFLTLPYTNRQLSADRDAITLPVHHLLQYVIILASALAVVKGYFNFFPADAPTCE